MRLVLKGIVGGVLGVWLALGSWHVWNDHATLHQIISALQQAAQRVPAAEGK